MRSTDQTLIDRIQFRPYGSYIRYILICEENSLRIFEPARRLGVRRFQTVPGMEDLELGKRSRFQNRNDSRSQKRSQRNVNDEDIVLYVSTRLGLHS